MKLFSWFLYGSLSSLILLFWVHLSAPLAQQDSEPIEMLQSSLRGVGEGIKDLKLELQDLEDQLMLQQNALAVEAMLQVGQASAAISQFQEQLLHVDGLEEEYLNLLEQQRELAGTLLQNQNEFMTQWWVLERYLEDQFVLVRDELRVKEDEYRDLLVKVMTLSPREGSGKIFGNGNLQEHSRDHR